MYTVKVIYKPLLVYGHLVRPRKMVTEYVNTVEGVNRLINQESVEKVLEIIDSSKKDVTNEFVKNSA